MRKAGERTGTPLGCPLTCSICRTRPFVIPNYSLGNDNNKKCRVE